jgi:endonuclease YncB( thermonuclease family)
MLASLIRLAAIAIIASLLSGSGALGAEFISGEPRIVDGDTVQIGATKIRFAGIDAPETDQVCLDAKGAKWACGVTARDELIKYSAGRSWDCDLAGTDRYGRALGKCFVEGEDVSAWLVRSGWALSFVRYSHEYDRDETAAREAKAGLWSGAFIAPWDWRHRSGATVVRGALSVPVDAQKTLLGARMVKKLRLLKGGSVPTFLVLGGCCTTSLPWTLEEGRRGSQAILDTAG